MAIKVLRLYLRSLGCKANLADTACFLECLPPVRVEVVDTVTQADLAVINTCTVTHRADSDTRKILGSLQREVPNLPVVVTGCFAKQHANRIRLLFSNVIAVHGIDDRVAWQRLLRQRFSILLLPPSRVRQDGFRRLGRARAFLKVQDGCNSRCTYCIVPLVRGDQRSLSPDHALAAASGYLRQGHAEIVLTGIHLGRWGLDLSPKAHLAELLMLLAKLFKQDYPHARLRLSSIEPLEWDAELIDAIACSPFVCRHFHVPLQSGDDDVLRMMGRPYDSGFFKERLDTLHRTFPTAAIGTDIIVGFPGEGEAAYRSTLELLQSSVVDYLHVFPFSARPGTPATDLYDRPAAYIVKQRASILRQHGNTCWMKFLDKAIGTSHRIVVESCSPREARGLSAEYRRFIVRGISLTAENQVIEARAVGREDNHLVGCATNPEDTVYARRVDRPGVGYSM